MKKMDNPKRWRKLLPMLLVCLFGLAGSIQAATKFENTFKIVEQPRPGHPYITIEMVYYDWTNGSNSFFLHDSGDGSHDGPAVWVDGKYICSPDWELAWPDTDLTGNGSGASSEASKVDEWWGKRYTKAYSGINYVVRFWNPYESCTVSKNRKFSVRMCIYMGQMEVGATHTIRIRGKWKINGEGSYWVDKTVTTNALSSPWGAGEPTAKMTNNNTVVLNGTLSRSYTTKIGFYKTSEGSAPSGFVAQNKLSGVKQYTADSYSDLSSTYTRSADNQYNGSTVAVQYFSELSADNEIITIYRWYNVNVPGFVKPVNVGAEPETWSKSVCVTWDKETSNSRSTEGTWSVFRDNTEIASKLSYGTSKYDDKNVPEYNRNYTYKVAFIPKDAPNGTVYSKLSGTKVTKVERTWNITGFTAEVTKDNKIQLNWNHNAINDASGSKPYQLKLQRSDDGGDTWSDLETFTINSEKTTSGKHTDNFELAGNHAYSYKLSISLLESDYEKTSNPVTLDGTSLTSFTATRGAYNNMVKLTWKAKQVGFNETSYVVYRRPLGSNDEKDWVQVYSTSGTGSNYSYDDNTVLTGTYNEYKVAIVETLGNGNQMTYSSKTTDGFTYSTGVISGRLTYGTGTAVEGAKVTLKPQNGDGDISTTGTHSLLFTGNDAGLFYKNDAATVQKLFNKDFSIQMYINPKSSEMNDPNKQVYNLLHVLHVFFMGLQYDAATNAYTLRTWLNGTFENSKFQIPADEWSQITLVHNHDAQFTALHCFTKDTVMTDTVKIGTVVNWAKKNGNDPMTTDKLDIFGTAGSGDGSDNNFRGYADEFRFFTKALTEKEVQRNYNHPLAGNEDGLAIYYPFDEGLAVQTIAYDYSKTNGISNERHAKTTVAAYSTEIIPLEEQLSLMTYTDVNGNFTIRGVPFVGDGTSYSVIPTLGIHQFSPSSQSRFVSQSSLIHSGVDFDDVSSFPVSGTVFYENTTYPVDGVSFRVDGVTCTMDGDVITTNERGEYTISVPIGDHYIVAEKNGHTFALDGRYPAKAGTKHTFNQEIKNLEFYDNTLVNFTGRVVGGNIQGDKTVGFGLSTNNIGVAELQLTPLNTDYSLNSVKKYNPDSTAYWYDVNDKERNAESATQAIASNSWFGANKTFCNTIYINTDPKTGEFSAKLPPLEYAINSIKVVKTQQALLDNGVTVDMTSTTRQTSDTLYHDDGSYELYTYDNLYKKVHHSEPVFTVKQADREDGSFGIDSYSFVAGEEIVPLNDIYSVENGNVVYKYGAPLFIKEDNYIFNLEGYELYTNQDDKNNIVTDKVPLIGNVVTINNALSASQSVYVEDGTTNQGETVKAGQVVELRSNQLTLDSLGTAKYEWKAGLPNISGDFTRTISINYDIEGRPYQWSGNGMKGIILGSLATGNNFITAGPDKLLMILRDPPGTNSHAEWSTGSVTTSSHVKGTTFTENASVSFKHRFGLHTEIIAGTPGVGDITVLEAKDDLEIGAKMESEGESSTKMETTTTITQAFSTSSDPEYVGAQGDVFIGQSTNIIFGKARNVDFKREADGTIHIVLEDIMTTGLEFGTLFSYTLNYIENVLFPNYELLLDNKLETVSQQEYITTSVITSGRTRPRYITTLEADDPNFGKPGTYKFLVPQDVDENFEDSVIWIMQQLENWKTYLAKNEEEKVKAYENRAADTRNYSFDSGSDVTYSIQVDSTKTTTWDWKVSAGITVNNSFGFEVKGFGIECTIQDETMGGTHEVDENGKATSTTYSFTLSEEGDDDAISVDVFDYGSYGPIFRTRGGQTCNPYEGKVVTKYYQPGTVIMDATMQIEMPKIAVDIPELTDIPSGGTANYTLRLSNQSEIDEDVYYKLIMIDETNPNGAQLIIDGKTLIDDRLIKVPAGQTITKALQLKQTNQSILEYKRIGIVLASQTQYDPTSTWDVIADTTYISAYFVPSSSDVTMQLDNTLINSTTGTDLNVSFKDFDPNYLGLKAFRLQYRKQGSANWTQFKEYVLGTPTGNQEKLPSGGVITYKLPMASFSDGEYTFRVVSVSTFGMDEVYKYSQEIPVIKDMQRPRPLGQPEPADGILSIGDELSITFNEPFMNGEITKTGNFILTGVLNGATIDHETALRMSGSSMTASTEADINLAGKEFSFDMWVKIDGAGTILSHGNGANKFTVGVTSDNKLVVDIAGTPYKSNVALPTGKWIFLTLSFAKNGNSYKLIAAQADDAGTANIITAYDIKEYTGNGQLAVGKGMNGAIHELLLWDTARDITTALLDRSKSKNPSTRHLAGYWKMNEGEGMEITDFARARHMVMADESWYLNNENLSVEFTGNSAMLLNLSESPHTPGDDYMIEFWMRTSQSTGKAQLIQAAGVGLMLENGMLKLTSDANSFDASSVSLADNTWHHVALNVLRIGSAAVYVDGVRTVSTSAQNIGSIATDHMIVGATRTRGNFDYEYSNYFTGNIDEIRVWNATLDAGQISNKRKLRLTGTEEGLVAYYPFETKGLDSGNQVITKGYATDLAGRKFNAELTSGQLSYAPEAPALRNKQIETNVSYDYSASDTKIVITIDEDPTIIEGCYLNLTVRDLRDANGNYSEPVNWTVFVNRNELEWKEDELQMTTHVKDETSATATIINKGGVQQLWSISGMPSWLEVSADYGVTNPTAETRITFTVSESTPIGHYEETIYLKGNNGIETPLTVSVNVTGDVPSWSVRANDYEMPMSLISVLKMPGSTADDSQDLVAAFIDGVCRGVAHPEYLKRYDTYYVTMDIYGNSNDADKKVTFRAYDASTGTIYPIVETSETIGFNALDLIGRYDTPTTLTAVDKIEQTTELKKGWNWFSLYVKPDAENVKSVFGSVADGLVMVKGQSQEEGFIMHEGNIWAGSMKDLSYSRMYSVKMSADKDLSLIGSRINPQDQKITIVRGWNWIGYYGSQVISVTDALAGMNPQNGDIIKGQSGVAYYDNFEWNGSLKTLEPGHGYMIMSTTDAERQFSYPTVTTSPRRAPRRSSGAQSSFQPVDYHEFSGNMVVIAKVLYNGQPAKNAELGIFAEGQCRQAQFTDENGLVYMTVPGDKQTQLRAVAVINGQFYNIEQSVDYRNDDIIGTPSNPLQLTVGSQTTGISVINADSDDMMFDLQGRKIENDAENGIIIKGRKKIIK